MERGVETREQLYTDSFIFLLCYTTPKDAKGLLDGYRYRRCHLIIMGTIFALIGPLLTPR